jgi:carbon starvation protein
MGVNSLWPLFGIANQLLATVALCVATTILLRMGRARYAWVTLAPLAWLTAVTFTASWHKIFNPDPRIGFLADAARLAQEAPATAARAHEISRLMFNDRVDALVTALLAISVSVILLESVLLWSRLLRGRQAAGAKEAPFVPTRFAVEEQ